MVQQRTVITSRLGCKEVTLDSPPMNRDWKSTVHGMFVTMPGVDEFDRPDDV
jgi:hypothetical protein